MPDTPVRGPDHTLSSSRVEASAEPPRVFAVVDVRAFLKAQMDEELSSPTGGAASPGVETVCSCVPVAECACNTVRHYEGSSTCPLHCVTCVCVSKYWFPY